MEIVITSEFGWHKAIDEEPNANIDEEILNQIGINKKFDVANKTVVNYDNSEKIIKRDAQEKIIELKALLAQTDYQAIKYAEGQLTEAEYAEMKAQRQQWRDLINLLEEDT